MSKLRFRQVHLDFHTSEKIPGIGEQFDKRQFQKELQIGHINSITVFAKCHHGWSYFPTEANRMHPNLKFDLLGAELEACGEIDVKAPVYISAGLDEKEAVCHPEWISREADESTGWVNGFVNEPGFHLLCFNTGYLDLLLRQIEEVMHRYHPCGIFLDISAIHPCYCSRCRQDIVARGKDIRDFSAVMEQAELVYKNYGEQVEKLIHGIDPACTIFHNAGHITRGRRDIARYDTHLELESLPTGGWGYSHFPMSASYVSGLGMEFLGMTGKFHNTWGEFGGFKHPNALRYETSLCLAFGAKSSVGDQMHPSGHMDESTYALIGKAYAEVEEKEAWCDDAVNLADIAVLGDEAVNSAVSDRDAEHASDIGANRMMLEGKYLYRMIDLQEDFSAYKLIILPDAIRLTPQLAERLQAYLNNGGKVLASGLSGLKSDADEFALHFGADFKGENSCRPDYIIPNFDFVTGHSPHVMYGQGYLIEINGGKCEAQRCNPYFNRDITHFSSHQHTPNKLENEGAAVSATEQTAYISWNVFSDYAKSGSLHLKELVIHLIDNLLGDEKTIEAAGLPDRAITTLTFQKEQQRYVNHLLFAHTTVRGSFALMEGGNKKDVEVIEDIVPLYGVKVKVRLPKCPRHVRLVPQGVDLPFTYDGGAVRYEVPCVECHQMVEIS